jgi:hypothetical protein
MSTSKIPERVPHEAAFAMISLGILTITLYVIDADVSHFFAYASCNYKKTPDPSLQ